MLKDQILKFYGQLSLDENKLPAKVRVMNPYQNQEAEVDRLLHEFYGKYYSDTRPRGLILGINPGRLGAGQTGIPFTDSPSLRDACEISTSIETRETSSEFVYKMIEAYGGPDLFYQDWFIGAACPLGFLHFNEKGNWINWNYYDEEALFLAVKDFMIEQLRCQIELCGNPKSAVVWGTGKNMKYLTKLNKEAKLFESLIPLEHPRYIMQYKRKALDEYLQKFLGQLKPEPRD
ncbi:MAG: DUF4918 family protein [Bacteroidetes bacterium]|nr:DUF4918 family protein [Bacteroidota bacterium]